MKKVKEFKVNSYISLKFENEETILYVSGERFIQCKHLLINIPKSKFKVQSGLESIDEAEEKLKLKEPPFALIDPRVEFWGHCSNLQVWAENDYNTLLLHKNLAFPLLRKLVEVDDFKAKQVFKEEICKRLESGNKKVIEYLKEEGYLDYLSNEELLNALLKTDEAEAIIDIENYIGKKLNIYLDFFEMDPKSPFVTIEKNHLLQLDLGECYSLDTLHLVSSLCHLRSLEYVYLEYNDFNLIKVLVSFPALKQINIGHVIYSKKNLLKKIGRKGN